MGQEERKVETMRGTVRSGRTVHVPHPTEKKVIGQNQVTGEPIRGPVILEYGPGAEVTLPTTEVMRLRELGFLIDPNTKPLPPSEGPHFTETART